MKKVIDGLLYNTAEATEVADYWNGLSCTDFGCLRETLFKTKKGRFFLHGEGGAMTEYASSYGNCRSGGSGIKPLTHNEARQWLEDTDTDVDLIEKHFKIQEA